MQTLRYVAVAFLVLALATCAVIGNYRLATWLLRLGIDPIKEASSEIPSVTKPLVLDARDHSTLLAARKAIQELGVDPAEIKRLPRKHPLLMELSWFQAANPYPPLLAEFNPAYDRQWSYFAFGYLGPGKKYHQILSYWGESATTPSFLVTKVRGEGTNEGDYFVNYVFLATKEISPTPQTIDSRGRATSWFIPAPTIDLVEWGSYEGGSYNGFEEIVFTATATFFELLVLAACTALIWRRRRRFHLSRVVPPTGAS
jgi:hypothetical protein